MQWYYADQDKPVGPLSGEDFQKLVATGTITAETSVWHDGMQDWAQYGSLAETVAPTPATIAVANTEVKTADTAACCECGKEFLLADMVKYQNATVCAGCKPVFFQRLQEGASLPGTLEYAGFWTRFAAKFVDGILMGIVNLILAKIITGSISGADPAHPEALGKFMVSQFALMAVQMALGLTYYVYFHGKFGQTPGKMACKIKVVRSDGSPLTYGRACGRFFGDMLSGMTLLIGYVMAAFDEEKRALHDRICDTRVVKTS